LILWAFMIFLILGLLEIFIFVLATFIVVIVAIWRCVWPFALILINPPNIMIYFFVVVSALLWVECPPFSVDIKYVNSFSACINYHVFWVLKMLPILKLLLLLLLFFFLFNIRDYLRRQLCDFEHLLKIKLIFERQLFLVVRRTVAFAKVCKVLVENKHLGNVIIKDSTKHKKSTFTFFANTFVSPTCI